MDKLELKSAFAADDTGAIAGNAWVFDTPDRIGDIIEKGAFTFPARLPILFAHDPAEPVGVWDDITETRTGLSVRGRLLVDDVARAREVRALVQAGAITGLSIGFTVKNATGRKGGGRNIKSLELAEISLVTVPMHPKARVTSAKSASDLLAITDAINRAALAFRTQGN
ncbi:MAG TPA: HK97 family phage prohead protease [Candidatus Dormibacteraeota bacterium]|nr:HK97 family phage prohead protease [Candidatus Dormibacteraeota bacterium]